MNARMCFIKLIWLCFSSYRISTYLQKPRMVYASQILPNRGGHWSGEENPNRTAIIDRMRYVKSIVTRPGIAQVTTPTINRPIHCSAVASKYVYSNPCPNILCVSSGNVSIAEAYIKSSRRYCHATMTSWRMTNHPRVGSRVPFRPVKNLGKSERCFACHGVPMPRTLKMRQTTRYSLMTRLSERRKTFSSARSLESKRLMTRKLQHCSMNSAVSARDTLR